MARIVDLLASGWSLSVELWPPRTEEAARRLEATLTGLEALHPTFASITYGAAGSTRERTHELVLAIQRAGRMTPMAHLVCAAHRRAELVDILTRYRDHGVENILALRGDPPLDTEGPLPAGDLRHAIELVVLAKSLGDFCVAVAAHPEGHPEAPDLATDRAHLAEKLALADFAITQFFFRADDYFGLVADLEARGVRKPVLPGIMPVTNVRTLKRMAELSGCTIPPEVAGRVEAVAGDPEAVVAVGVEVATRLGEELLAGGVPGLHFYTMNQVRATLAICENLGIARRA
ncbi:MAG TPA: methylenetetrahydrofolate reductase [Acidimicrobiales bacterium]|nr:methylenetetrahydrofolate reductase [Acidimicrobiales bacterium]